MQIPAIGTERLILRKFRKDTDFDLYAEFISSESTRFYGGPLDRSAARRTAAAMMGHWIIRGYGAWTVEERLSGGFCGIVGLWSMVYGLWSIWNLESGIWNLESGIWNLEGWPERKTTWAIIDSKQGNGFAAEAAMRSRHYAYDTVKWGSVYKCISCEKFRINQLY